MSKTATKRRMGKAATKQRMGKEATKQQNLLSRSPIPFYKAKILAVSRKFGMQPLVLVLVLVLGP
jgi:hypothetical protein